MPTLDEKVDQLVTDVSEIRIALKGYSGDTGLLKSHECLKKDFYNFRLLCIVIFSSAGIFGGGGFWLSKIVEG